MKKNLLKLKYIDQKTSIKSLKIAKLKVNKMKTTKRRGLKKVSLLSQRRKLNEFLNLSFFII